MDSIGVKAMFGCRDGKASESKVVAAQNINMKLFAVFI